VTACRHRVRFALQSGHSAAFRECRLGAKSGHPVDTSLTPSEVRARLPPSTKSGLFHPFEHMIPCLFRAELSGEHPGVKEGP
jgi:hypothetical protein